MHCLDLLTACQISNGVASLASIRWYARADKLSLTYVMHSSVRLKVYVTARGHLV